MRNDSNIPGCAKSLKAPEIQGPVPILHLCSSVHLHDINRFLACITRTVFWTGILHVYPTKM